MLKIKNITAKANAQPVFDDISLEVKQGEIHAIMGPAHSGKSAFAHIITGHPSVDVVEGDIYWGRKKIQNLSPSERNELGIYISFQYPPEFESITNYDLTTEFFKPYNVDPADLELKYKTCCALLDLGSGHGDLTPSITNMTLHQAKRNELIFMLMSSPKLIILDEIDKGLDDEQVIVVATILRDYIKEGNRSCIVITHNKELLNILQPTHVHVMVDGEIKVSGDGELYKRIIEDGYSEFS